MDEFQKISDYKPGELLVPMIGADVSIVYSGGEGLAHRDNGTALALLDVTDLTAVSANPAQVVLSDLNLI